MLGKLMKLEYKSSHRLMFLVWGVLLIASVFLNGIERLIIYSDNDAGYGFLRILEGLSATIYVAVLVALIVTTILIVVMRFYKGLLGDEGYLVNTLPVTKRQIIFSKGIMATAIIAVSVVVATISFMIVSSAVNHDMPSDMIKAYKTMISEEPRMLLFIIEIFVLVVIGVLLDIYKIYASIAIGQISDRHRVISSFGAYLGINTAMYLLITVFITLFADDIAFSFTITNENMSNWGYLQLGMLIALIVEVAFIAIFHIITEQLLTKKLNLQ